MSFNITLVGLRCANPTYKEYFHSTRSAWELSTSDWQKVDHGVNKLKNMDIYFAEPLITDYQEATSAYEDAYVTGNFNLNDGNQDQSSYDLDLEVDYEKVLSSADRNIKLDFSATGSRSRGSNADDQSQSNYQLDSQKFS